LNLSVALKFLAALPLLISGPEAKRECRLSIDVIERRRAVEERLRRARNLSQALDQATADVVESSGLTIDDLDPEGSLRTAVTTLAGVAALRPGFEVLVSLPALPFALRLRHLADDVDITLVQHEISSSDPPESAETPEIPAPRGFSEAPEASATADPAPPENAEAEGHVASDLAAMLWGDVSPP
jgi:hypothetical protein